MDWPQRILFFVGTVSVLFAVAMLSGFAMEWRWWWRELAFMGVACVCVLFKRNRVVMVAAIALIVASRLLIALVAYLVSRVAHP
jgi:hypothetical protein